ncbi:MAG: hypothetical protein K0B07_00190 [DPANN group archaeon]|nr:hypothetical protein [DPANN group archaeon]
MFRPEKMEEIYILGLRKEKDDILKRLQHLGTIHLTKTENTGNLETPKELIHETVINLDHIRTIKKVLDTKKNIFKKDTKIIQIPETEDIAFATVSKIYIEPLFKNAKNILESEKIFSDKKNATEKKLDFLNHFAHVNIKDNAFSDTKKYISSIASVKTKDFDKIKDNCDLKVIDETEDTKYIIFIAKKEIWIDIKKYMYLEKIDATKTIKDNIKETKTELDTIDKETLKIKESEKLIQKEKNKILAYEERWENIKTRLSKEKLLNHTEKTFVLRGWIPTTNIKELETIENIVVYTQKPKTEPPIKLKNPNFAQPFEKLTRWFGLPEYEGIDPTIFIAVAFPIFFAIMLTDMAYGLILLAASLFAYLKTDDKDLKALSYIMIVSSVATIFAGLIFGSIFGDFLGFVSVFDALRDPITILKVSLAIGLVHINFGLALDLYSKIKSKSKNILDPLSWVSLEIGVTILVIGQGIPKSIGCILIIATIIYRSKDGPTGILSVPSFFGSWISYIRLMALAVATSWLQFVINMGVTAAAKLSIILAGLVFVIGHSLNMALNVVSAFVHSMRLHYVEFFERFYESGGEEFKPLENKNKYSR